MGNLITNEAADNLWLKLSNGATSVVLSALTLSGSRLAKQSCEIDLITWLTTRDQSVVGLGVVGFDVSELPWATKESVFSTQKIFLLKVCQRVKDKEDLGVLTYDPPFIEQHMEEFSLLVTAFKFENVRTEKPSWWLVPDKNNKKCKQHGVFLHSEGCVVCNDK